MKSVGIFICNYNKRDFVVNCVKSLLGQNFRDFDLFVVDNASTDDSVEKLREVYGDKITIIENSENLGGSGGFNTGIRRGYNDGYKYIMLVDNDTVFDSNAVGELYKFLEENSDAGMAGSKVLYMQNPSVIQEFGGKIYWENYSVEGRYKGNTDSSSLLEFEEVDYLAACSLMVKREVIDKIGFMDEECFIYWDDTDWGHRCKLSGYKCYAISSSKVLHNGSFVSRNNLGFSSYYFFRNKYNFFAKYIDEENIEEFAKASLSEVYKRLVGYYCKKQYDMVSIFMYMLDDFLHGVRGKATSQKTSRTLKNLEIFDELVLNNNKVLIKVSKENVEGNFEDFINVIRKCSEINSKIVLYVEPIGLDKEQLNKIHEYAKVYYEKDEKFDLIFYFCKHVMDIKKCMLPEVCIDKYFNCVFDEDTYKIYSNIEGNEKLFIELYKKLFIERVNQIRSGKNL